MKKFAVMFSLMMSVCAWNLVSAVEVNDLFFPNKPEEIEQVLGQTPNLKLTHQCPKFIPNCEPKKATQAKGLKAIVSDNPDLPKVGALIHFDFNSTTIRSDSDELLGYYGKALQTKLKNVVLVIAGHADYKGTEEYNQTLSERRAKAVKNFLISVHQIKPYRLHTIGFGETQPLLGNRYHQTAEERKWNRRVEFIRVK
ncbi:MAG: hypothetical protein DRR19_12375 [Candidatus Parabeggiatoa sp. nov. 1]|nr:MAG: hypothetical protein DRR19_12375 [Gammaproteobacteria bacterium]